MARLEFVAVFGLIVLMLISLQASTIAAHAALTIPTWAKTYHSLGAGETVNSIEPTADGGYIAAGTTNSSGTPGKPHAWVFKLDSLGNVVWQKTYGGTGPDSANSVQQTLDGGFIVAGGLTNSSTGVQQGWLFKLNATGSIVWQKIYVGGLPLDTIWQSSDGGFIVAGSGQISCLFCFGGAFGEWVVKLDPLGNISWQKVFSLGNGNYASSVIQTSDGGFIVAGRVKQCCSAGNADNWDALIFKLNATGGVVWQKTYGGPDFEEAQSIQQTSDGGLIVAGVTDSFGDQTGCFPGLGCKAHDWVFKLNSTGGMVWQRTYGDAHSNSINEQSNSIDQTSDGGFVIVGPTSSPGGAWIYKLDPAGNILWQNGGSSTAVDSVHKTTDGGIVAAGPRSASASGASIVKLDGNGGISSGCNLVGSANFTATNTNGTTTTAPLVVNTTLATVATSNATVSVSSEGTSVQCSGTGTGIGSSSTRTVVFDAATNAGWSGTETTGASAYDTASVTVPGPAIATGTVTYTFYSNNTCSGTGSSAGRVSLTSTGAVPNSNTEGPLAAGSYSFKAFYSGDLNYNNSTSQCEPFTVLLPNFAISANHTSLTIRLGTSNTSVITINSVNGFSGAVSLSASISPQVKGGPSVVLSSNAVTVSPGTPANVRLTVGTKGGTPTGNYTVTVSATSGTLSHTVTLSVSVVKKK